MSYTIEYKRQALKMPKGTKIAEGFGKIAHELWEDEIFLFIKSGCNNVHPRPKTWHLHATGWNYSIIQTVCERAGSTEGGCIKMNGKDTTPENYIKLYRKVIAEAEIFSLEKMKELTGIYGVNFYFGNKEVSDYVQKSIETIKEAAEDQGKWYDYQKYFIPFTSMEQWQIFYNCQFAATETGGFISMQSDNNE